jgi:tetratricopeptide (TPR) repeat protein
VRLLSQPGQHKTGRELLETTLAYYQKFLERQSDDPDVCFDAAVAWRRVGRIRHTLGELVKADEAYQQGGDLLEQLVARFPENRDYRAALMTISIRHGNVLRDRDQFHQAIRVYDRAIELCEELMASAEDRAGHQSMLANAILNRAVPRLRLGEVDAVIEDYHQVIKLQRAALATDPGNAGFRFELALGLDDLGMILWRQSRHSEAEDLCRQALELRKALSREKFNPYYLTPYLARSHDHLATIDAAADRSAEAIRHLREATILMEGVVNSNPQSALLRSELAWLWEHYGHLQRGAGQPVEANAAYGRTIAHCERLVADGTTSENDRSLLFTTLFHRANLARFEGPLKAAIPDLQRVIAFRKERLAAADTAATRSALALAHYELALVFRDLKRSADAEKAFTEALLLREALYRAGDRTPMFLRALASNHREIGMLQASRRSAEAEKQYLRAREIGEQIVKAEPKDPEHGEALAQTCVRLAWLWEHMGRAEDARAAYRRAVQAGPVLPASCNELAWWLATCSDERDRDPRRAIQLAKKAIAKERDNRAFWNTLGVAHYRDGDLGQAIRSLEVSMRLSKGGDSFDWFFLAMALHRRGETKPARLWFDRAIDWMDRHRPKDDQLRRFRAEADALLGDNPKK